MIVLLDTQGFRERGENNTNSSKPLSISGRISTGVHFIKETKTFGTPYKFCAVLQIVRTLKISGGIIFDIRDLKAWFTLAT